MAALCKILTLATLTILLAACGEESNENSATNSTTPITPLFDSTWFSFNNNVNISAVNGKKTYGYTIYQNSITKDNNQVITNNYEMIVGIPPTQTSEQSAELLKAYSSNPQLAFLIEILNAPLYDLEQNILTEKKLLISHPLRVNEKNKTRILTHETAGSVTFVPYNTELYKDAAATTIQYVQNTLDGTLLADAIDTNSIAKNNPNLLALKNSGLKFPVGSVGIKQTLSTTHEDLLRFPIASVYSISDWKAKYGVNAVFKDMLWIGLSFSCLVDNSNVPTGACVINYNDKVYEANYILHGTSTTQYYFLFNKTAAEALAIGIKQYFINPTVVSE